MARPSCSRQDKSEGVQISELIMGLVVAFVLTIQFLHLPNSPSSPPPLMLIPRVLPPKLPAYKSPSWSLFLGNKFYIVRNTYLGLRGKFVCKREIWGPFVIGKMVDMGLWSEMMEDEGPHES